MDINIDALYNILKQNQGDVNDAIGSKKKTVVVTSNPLALIAEKMKVSKSKEKVVSSDSEGSEAYDFSELKKITALLAKAFNRRKFYSKPTNNNLRTSSTTYIRYLQVINDLKKCGYSKDNCELNFKFLNNLQPEWKQYATMMRQNKNLMDINIDALYNILKQNQGDVNDDMGSKKKTVVVTFDPLALSAEKMKVSKSLPKLRFEKDHLCSTCEQGKIHRKHHKSKTGFCFKQATLSSSHGFLWTDARSKTPQQNGVVERRNRTLVEAARTMLTFANLPLFLWAEAIATACFTQNHLIIHKRLDKTPYELMNKRKPNIKLFHMFGCRCYLLNVYEDVRKLKAKGDIRVFVGYSKESASFRIYNKRTRKIHKSVNVNFDEISEMASKQFSLELGLSNLNEMGESSNPLIMKSSTTNVETSINEEVFHEVSESFQGESSSSSLNDDVQHSPEEVILPQTNTQSISINMIPNGDEASILHNVFNERLEDAYFDVSTSFHDPSNVHTFYQPYPHENKWTKDHPLHKIIGDPKSSVRTRGQLANSCLFSCLLSSIEPANVAEALKDADWVSAMQEELDQFVRLKVWRLVPRPEGKTIIKTKWIFKNKKDESSLVIRNKARLVALISSLKPYVRTVILEKFIIDLEDEVVCLLEKEKANLETIESLKSKDFESSENAISKSENQSENDCQVVEKEYLDTFSSVRRPKHSVVIWKKKGSSNTSNVDLSSVSYLKLNKDVKRYSRKDLLSCNNSHLGETSSAYVCNNAMNVSCNSRMCDLFDENNLLIFDDESVRISPISKMPFRKKPRDSINVCSKSNSNKSLPRTVHRWLPKMQPLAEPVAKWIPRIVQICLWIIDSECSKHMTGNRALLANFMEKFLETVRFGNNDFAVIAGYGDVVIG
nr:hypothetical protein [Tanacetum cinerariifolium]